MFSAIWGARNVTINAAIAYTNIYLSKNHKMKITAIDIATAVIMLLKSIIIHPFQ